MYDDVSSALHKLQTTQSTNLNELITCLVAMEGLVEARRLQTSESFAEDDTRKSKEREEMMASMREQQQIMQEQLEKLVEMSKCHSTAIMEDLSTFEFRSRSHSEAAQSVLDSSRAELSAFLVEQSQRLHELQAVIDVSIKQQGKELDESKMMLIAALRDNHAQHQEELCGLKARLAQYVEECVQRQKDQLDKETLLIMENAKNQQKHALCVKTVTEQHVKGLVQAMDDQGVTQKSATTGLSGRLAEMQDQLVAVNARQKELAQSHQQLHTTWGNATTELATKHTDVVDSLLEKHVQAHTATSTRKREQLVQFVGAHEQLRQCLSGRCQALEDEFHIQMSSTKSKLELISTLGKNVAEEATAASKQQLQNMETYIKKRKVSTCSTSPLLQHVTY